MIAFAARIGLECPGPDIVTCPTSFEMSWSLAKGSDRIFKSGDFYRNCHAFFCVVHMPSIGAEITLVRLHISAAPNVVKCNES
jgi:hypothetical protein